MLTRLSVIAFALIVLTSRPASAAVIDITTAATQTSQASYTFGDWIFELVAPANLQFNLIDASTDFIVTNASTAGDITLRRLDNAPFTLLSLVHAGGIALPPSPNTVPGGITQVGGVDIVGPGNQVFQTFAFAGQAGVTNVSSVVFSPDFPNRFFQLASFEVTSPTNLPEPSTLLVVGLAIAAGVRRRTRARTRG